MSHDKRVAEFLLHGAEFGVETSKSRVVLVRKAKGPSLLTLEIKGNDALYSEIAKDEGSKWKWTLYPPYFYLPIRFRKRSEQNL